MKHSAARILGALLIEGSSAPCTRPEDDGRWPVLIASQPHDPDDVVVLYDTEGVGVTRLLAGGKQIEKLGVQILVRDASYDHANDKAQQIADLLEETRRHTLLLDGESYTLDCVTRTSPIFGLGQDERRRQTFSLNVLVQLLSVMA